MRLACLALAAAVAPLTHAAVRDVDDSVSRQGAGPELPADQGQCLNLPCEQCLGTNSHIRLEFAVDGGNRLLVNDFELYPGTGSGSPRKLMTAVFSDDGTRGEQLHERSIGYEVDVSLKARDDVERIEIINVECSILEVEGQAVRGVPHIHIELVKLATGSVLIGTVATRRNTGMDCSSLRCWAYRIAQWDDDALGRCCTRLASPSGDASEAGTVHPSHWHQILKLLAPQTLQPVLLGLGAVVLVVSFAMLCYKAICQRRPITGQHRQPAAANKYNQAKGSGKFA